MGVRDCYGRGTDPSNPLGQVFHQQFRCWASETVVVGGGSDRRVRESSRARQKEEESRGLPRSIIRLANDLRESTGYKENYMKRTRDRASDLKRQYRGEPELKQGSEGAGGREEEAEGWRSFRGISSVSSNMKTRALQMRYLEIVQ